MLTRGRNKLGFLIKTTTSYHPHNLLYHKSLLQGISGKEKKEDIIRHIITKATALIPAHWAEA